FPDPTTCVAMAAINARAATGTAAVQAGTFSADKELIRAESFGVGEKRSLSPLVEFAVLHDDVEILCGIAEQIDSGERVAVHQNQIGQRTFLDDTERSGIGRART